MDAELHEHCINIIGSPPFHNDCCIYRVHKGLRRVKPDAYEPMVVSIGPYHRKNPKLQAMENHKRWYLRLLLERRQERNETKETYTLVLRGLVERVRNCYAEPIDLNGDEFVEMMLLDGCFIIEFFRNQTPNPTLSVEWMKQQIYRDLMLLENQLPFFLLNRLYEMTSQDPEEEPSLMEMAKLVFREPIPRSYLNSRYFDSYPSRRIKHLLHLVHVLCHPIRTPIIAEGLKISNIIRALVLLPVRIPFNAFLYLLILINFVISPRDETRNEDETRYQMHCAVELVEAGVKFKKVPRSNLFDIKFNYGLMEVPCFTIQDSTDTFFRNLIAFEQHSRNVNPKFFTDYIHFMDQLISSEKDVELLRHAGIIQNLLGDDKEVSNLFNKLGDGVILYSPSFYAEERTRVNMHCRKMKNRVLAKLMHDYFNNPWASFSTLGAIVLLGLAIAQTVGTYNKRKQ